MRHKRYCNYPSDPCDCGEVDREIREVVKAIINARRVKQHEATIRKLRAENRKLKKEMGKDD